MPQADYFRMDREQFTNLEVDSTYREFNPTDPDIPPDIVGPISRADERAIRYVHYFPTTAFSGSTTLTSPFGIAPDYWRLILCGRTGAPGQVILTQENDTPILMPLTAAGAAADPMPQRVTIPGRPGSRTLIVNGSGGTFDGCVAAVWGYDPKDVF